MSDQAITTLSSLSIVPDPDNNNNGFYLPQLTDAQIAAIPNETLRNGALIYNTTTNTVVAKVNGGIVAAVTPAGPGDVSGPAVAADTNIATFDGTTGKLIADSGVAIGDVVSGPAVAVDTNIAVFDGTTGKLIADSGVIITQVPAPPATLSNKKNKALVDVAEIGNLGHVKFVNDVGVVFVDSLMPVEFIVNDFGLDSQACSLFTGGLPSSSTTVSSLVEIQSTTGALVVSRMTEAERDALFATAGMVMFNTDSSKLNVYSGTDWIEAADLISENLATQNLFIGSEAGSVVVTTGFTNLAIGNKTLNDLTTGDNNIALGQGSGENITVGGNNISIGSNSLNTSTSADNNISIGVGCLKNATIATSNIAIGDQVLFNSTSSINNIGIGRNCLLSNINGFDNIAIGERALQDSTSDSNIALGHDALANNTFGSENISIGQDSMLANLNGSFNVSIGHDSGASFDITKCVFLGNGADATLSVTNSIAIGDGAVVSASNAMVLGNGCSVGIGTSTPLALLHLANGGIAPRLLMESTTIPVAPAANSGIYSVTTGKPIFTSTSTEHSGTIQTIKDNFTYGEVVLNGTTGVFVSTSAISPASRIFVSRACVVGVPSLVNIGNIVPGNRQNGNGFTIYSTNASDFGFVNWVIITE